MSKLFNRSLLMLLIMQFLVMVGFGIVIPILPYFITKLGGGAFSLGVFMSVYSIMQFIFAPVWGKLSDRIGRKPVLLIGLGGYGVTFIMFGMISNLYLLIILRALAGFASSATLPTAMAYLADITTGSDRSKGMGMLGASMGLGMIFGPALGGWLGEYSFSVPFFVAGGLALLLLPFTWLLLPESLQKNSGGAGNQRAKLTLNVIRDPLFALFLYNFSISFTMSIFESTFTLLAAAKVGFGPGNMGITFAILGVFAVIVQGMLIGRLVKKFNEASLTNFGAVLSAVGLILIILFGNAVLLVLSAAVFMIGNSLMKPTTSSLVSKQNSQGQGSSLGFFQAFGSLGRVFGPILGGALFEIKMGLPYIVAAIFMLLIAALIGSKIDLKVKERLVQE